MSAFHTLSTAESSAEFNVDPTVGLASARVQAQRSTYGANALPSSHGRSALSVLIEQFRSAMVVMLLVAAVLSLYLGDAVDAVAVLAIVVLNALLGFTQDVRAERAMEALQALSAPRAHVRRDGSLLEIDAAEVVVGDLLVLQAGDQVTADGRVLEAEGLALSEAALTGESMLVDKRTAPLPAETPLSERANMAYRGTAATRGRGLLLVTAVGPQTELGRIATMLTDVTRERTPLQDRLAHFGRVLSVIALGLVLVVVLLGYLRGEALSGLVMAGLSLAVAAVPEGLPAVATVALALGARRMLAREALVRKLPAVETMGSVTVVCTDKTGTLTENRMVAAAYALPTQASHAPQESPEGAPEVRGLFACAALCNDARTSDDDSADPTETALLSGAESVGIELPILRANFPRQGGAPFDSERMRMATLHQIQECATPLTLPAWLAAGKEALACIKGSTSSVLDVCDAVMLDGHRQPMTAEHKATLLKQETELAQSGLRVLGVAARRLPEDEADTDVNSSALEQDATFVGMIALQDPLRPEAARAVAQCQQAGIRPVMITGDHPRTAGAIGRALGLDVQEHGTHTGAQLDAMSDAEFDDRVKVTSIYARVSPEHKLRIVRALQRQGNVVAMTGDGVNDAPALKQANIGVAMGRVGTDVAREAADAVLLDDNFATIVHAVEEGRTIFQNVRKFLRYTMTSNAGEIATMLLGPLLGMPLPLLPLQILWVNLVTDGVPGLALAAEPTEPDTMTRPPRAPDAPMFDRALAIDVLWIGALMGTSALGAAYYLAKADTERFRTVVFTVLTLAQLGNALSVRSERQTLPQLGLRSNWPLTITVVASVIVQLALLYVPLAQQVFHVVALSPRELGISVLCSLTVLVAGELRKALSPKAAHPRRTEPPLRSA